MRCLTRALERFLVLRPRFLVRLSVWRRQSTKLSFQKIAATSGIISTIETGFCSRSSICLDLFNLNAKSHPQPAKLRLTSSLAWLLANGQVLIKVLLNFLLLILLNEKRRGNKGVLGKKASSITAFLILTLHKSFEDALLLLPLHSLIVLSSPHLFAAKLSVSVFDEDNTEKSNGDDQGSTSIDAIRGMIADNLGIEINTDARANNSDTAADNSSIVADNPGITTDDPGRAINNLGTAADNPSKTINNPGKRTDANAGADNPNIAVNNKTCAASLFALRRTLFFPISSSELVTTSLLSSLPFSCSTTLRSKLILLCSIILVKQKASFFKYSVDEHLVSIRSY